MIRRVLIFTRTIAVAAVATAVGYFIPLVVVLSPRVHGWVLTSIAVLFAITDLVFGNLISELNTVFRRPSYSVHQVEELQQRIPAFRKGVWHLWFGSMLLKAIVGVTGIVLGTDGISKEWQDEMLFAGYSYTIVMMLVTLWTVRNFRRFEKIADDLNVREIQLSEQKRLKAAMTSGDPVDFKKDKTLLTYSKPAHEV